MEVQVRFDTLRRRRLKTALHLWRDTNDARNDGQQSNCWTTFSHYRPSGKIWSLKLCLSQDVVA